MINCDDIRTRLALDPNDEAAHVHEHLSSCKACGAYARRNAALDLALRAELNVLAPALLTARLLAMAANPLTALPAALARPAPKAWYVKVVSFLTIAAVVISLLVIWQLLVLVAGQIGLNDALIQLSQAPALGLARLTEALPQSRFVIDAVVLIRDQSLWLLLAAVLWAVFDRWTIQGSTQHQSA